MDPLPGFLERLGRGEDSGSATVGFALFLRQITDWVYRSRASPEEWARTKDRLASATVAVKQNLGPEYGAGAEKTLEALDFRSRIWIREYGGWVAVRDADLSDSALLQWEHRAIGSVPDR